MKKIVIAITIGLASSSAASAATITKDDLAKCAAEANAVSRLVCFDTLAKQAGATASTTETTRQGAGKWSTRTQTDPLTDKSVYTAALDASSGAGRFGGAVLMLVRCKDNKTEMYIDWRSYLGNDGVRTTYRVGKVKAKTSRWSESTDHKAAFFPGSPVSLLKEIIESDSFVANVTPYSESPVTAVFDTTGAAEALVDIRKGCNW